MSSALTYPRNRASNAVPICMALWPPLIFPEPVRPLTKVLLPRLVPELLLASLRSASLLPEIVGPLSNTSPLAKP